MYGPIITPYLLLREYLHRMNGEGRSFGFKDFVEGLTGANFRNMRSFDKTIAELLDSLQGEEFSDINNYAAALGKTIGEAATGFGQLFLQFGDFRFDFSLLSDSLDGSSEESVRKYFDSNVLIL